MDDQILIVLLEIAHSCGGQMEIIEMASEKAFDDFGAIGGSDPQKLRAPENCRAAPENLVDIADEISRRRKRQFSGAHEAVGCGRQKRKRDQFTAVGSDEQAVVFLFGGGDIPERSVFIGRIEDEKATQVGCLTMA